MTATADLAGDRVRLRPVAPVDLERLVGILHTPEVSAWWPTYDLARARSEFLDPDPDYDAYVIEVDGRIAGLIQSTEEPEPEFRQVAIDLFVAPADQAQGIGPDAIRTLIRYLIGIRGHHRITIDPAAANDRAIRAYAKVGFRPVGVMRSYQRFADGTWRDALLMDLLADELR